jgi:hypothetical protein
MKIAAVKDQRETASGGVEYLVRFKDSSRAAEWVPAAKVRGEPLRRYEDLRAAREAFSTPTGASPSPAKNAEHGSDTPTIQEPEQGSKRKAGSADAPRGSSRKPAEPGAKRPRPSVAEPAPRPAPTSTTSKSVHLAPPVGTQTQGERAGPALTSPRSFKGLVKGKVAADKAAAAAPVARAPVSGGAKSPVFVDPKSPAKGKAPRRAPLFREDSVDFVVVRRDQNKRAPLTAHQREVRQEQKQVGAVAERALLESSTGTLGGSDSQSLAALDRSRTGDAGGGAAADEGSNTSAHVPPRFQLNRSTEGLPRADPVPLRFGSR